MVCMAGMSVSTISWMLQFLPFVVLHRKRRPFLFLVIRRSDWQTTITNSIRIYFRTDCEVDDEMLAHISKTVQLFYAIAKLDGYILSQDSCLLTEWKWFNQNLNTNIKDLYMLVLCILFIEKKNLVWNNSHIPDEVISLSSPSSIVLTNQTATRVQTPLLTWVHFYLQKVSVKKSKTSKKLKNKFNFINFLNETQKTSSRSNAR